MNKKQLCTMWVGILVIVAIWLFPPWQYDSYDRWKFACFHFVFARPQGEVTREDTNCSIDRSQLAEDELAELDATVFSITPLDGSPPAKFTLTVMDAELEAKRLDLLSRLNDMERESYLENNAQIVSLRDELEPIAEKCRYIVWVSRDYKYKRSMTRLDWFCIGWLHGLTLLLTTGFLITFKTRKVRNGPSN